MADIKQKYKTPSGDNIVDKDFLDFKEADYTNFKNTTNTNLNNAIAEINKIKNYLQTDEVPVGTIIWYSSNNPPSDTNVWKACNGQSLNKSDYRELWDLIGNNAYYGNNGGDVFKIPELLEEKLFVRSTGTQYVVGEKQVDSIRSHGHSVTAYKSGDGAYGNWGMSNWQMGEEKTLHVENTGEAETRPKNIAFIPFIKCKKRGGI